MNATTAKTTPRVPPLRFPEFSAPWQEKRLGDVTHKVDRSSTDNTLPVMTISAGNGFLMQTDRFSQVIAGSSLKKYTHVLPKEFSYNRGASKKYPYGCVYLMTEPKGALVPFVYRSFRITDAVPEFCEQYFIAGRLNSQLRRVISSSARLDGLLNISETDFYASIVWSPHPDEQQKIADFLGAVDRRLAGLRARRDALKTYKRGVMQQIFSQRIRFTAEDGTPFPDWQEKRLGDVFDERSERNQPDLPLLAVTMADGIVTAATIARKDSSSIKKDTYKRVAVGDIAYNTMRMWQGASGVSLLEGIVSPAYTVVIPKQKQCCTFWGHYFKLQSVIHLFERYSQGLTSDTWNLKFPAFSKIQCQVPHPEEQQKIADFLGALDRRIDATTRQITATEAAKRALLQQMFV